MVVTTVQDTITSKIYHIRSKYLFGADGAKSRIVEQLGLPLTKKPSQGVALNVLVKADLSKLMKTRTGNLHWIIQPDIESPDFAWWAIMRMVKPWTEWLVILLYKQECDPDFTPTEDQVMQRTSELIGDDTIPVELVRIDKWIINETIAESYSKGRVYVGFDLV